MCVCVCVCVCVRVRVCASVCVSARCVCVRNMLTGEIHKNTNIKLTLFCIAPDTSQSDGSQAERMVETPVHVL